MGSSPCTAAPIKSLSPGTGLLIGVLTTDLQRMAAEEFFQLFKAPWSFYDEQKANSFSAIIVTSSCNPVPNTGFLICCGPEESSIDEQLGLKRSAPRTEDVLRYNDLRFPIHTRFVVFDGDYDQVVASTDAGEPVAIIAQHNGMKVLRVGYDLFAEVDHLLSTGQAPSHALSPTIEIQISILRNILLGNGIPVIEIPPHPHGHKFIACLTHDIDFIGIKHHKFDLTLVGFVYRVLRSLFRTDGHQWNNIKKNFRALLSLPAVFLKIIPDFWYPMDRYSEIEKPYPSTYFFIPYEGRPGRNASGHCAFLRAARYNVKQYSSSLRCLEEGGHEVGVHGIDAWCDASSAKKELNVIREITAKEHIGIRMHWLYFSKIAPATLEQAGYLYDSSLGYNDAVGYRNGTTQVFKPLDVSSLLELPLNIQDTALFFPNRMNLSEPEALSLCRKVIEDVMRYGGVFTVNWHDRSLAPERNWDRSYVALLEELRHVNPWFAQVRTAVKWFQQRRTAEFESIEVSPHRIVVRLKNNKPNADLLPLTLRILFPASPPKTATDDAATDLFSSIEVPLNGEAAVTIVLSQ